MVTAEPPAGAVTLTYNAAGKRVEKETPTEAKKFIYDFEKVLQETDDSDVTQMEYTSTLREFGNLLSQFDGADSEYPAYDALGSTANLLNAAQTSDADWVYRAFGQVESKTGLGETDFTFVGQKGYFADLETDLYFLNERYEDPLTGRMLSEDRLGYRTGEVNMYLYADNNPVNKIDPSGLQVQAIDIKPSEFNIAPLTLFLQWNAASDNIKNAYRQALTPEQADQFDQFLQAGADIYNSRPEDVDQVFKSEQETLSQRRGQTAEEAATAETFDQEVQEALAEFRRRTEQSRLREEVVPEPLWEVEALRRLDVTEIQRRAKEIYGVQLALEVANAISEAKDFNQWKPWDRNARGSSFRCPKIRIPKLGEGPPVVSIAGFSFTWDNDCELKVIINPEIDCEKLDKLKELLVDEEIRDRLRPIVARGGKRAPSREEQRKINELAGGPVQPGIGRWLTRNFPELAQDIDRLRAIGLILTGSAELGLKAEQLARDGAPAGEIVGELAKDAVTEELVSLLLFKLGGKLAGPVLSKLDDWYNGGGRRILDETSEAVKKQFLRELEERADEFSADPPSFQKFLDDIEEQAKNAKRGAELPSPAATDEPSAFGLLKRNASVVRRTPGGRRIIKDPRGRRWLCSKCDPIDPPVNAGTPEHKALRWDEYNNKHNGNPPLTPEQWSARYDVAIANARRGNKFELSVREFTGGKRIPVKAANGDEFIADLDFAGVTDVKDVLDLASSGQLRAFAQHAQETQQAFNLIISPRTKTVSEPLQRLVKRPPPGKVYVFDSVTQSLEEAVFVGNKVVK